MLIQMFKVALDESFVGRLENASNAVSMFKILIYS